jgi:hypothetical protein
MGKTKTRTAIHRPPPKRGTRHRAPAKPIWEVFAEILADTPEEEYRKLPTDGAEQHDHYIYGSPKRPT